MPSVFVTVDRDGQPYCRIDAYCESRGPFCEMLVWHDFVVLGWSDVVHVVHPASRRVQNVICDGYFGHLYAYDRSLLIASASELICLNEQAIELWRRGDLGIDGVTIDRVNNGLIEGQGEWDPPGGWRHSDSLQTPASQCDNDPPQSRMLADFTIRATSQPIARAGSCLFALWRASLSCRRGPTRRRTPIVLVRFPCFTKSLRQADLRWRELEHQRARRDCMASVQFAVWLRQGNIQPNMRLPIFLSLTLHMTTNIFFYGNCKPSDEEFESLWKDGLFAFNASLSPNLYRYSPRARRRFSSTLIPLRTGFGSRTEPLLSTGGDDRVRSLTN